MMLIAKHESTHTENTIRWRAYRTVSPRKRASGKRANALSTMRQLRLSTVMTGSSCGWDCSEMRARHRKVRRTRARTAFVVLSVATPFSCSWLGVASARECDQTQRCVVRNARTQMHAVENVPSGKTLRRVTTYDVDAGKRTRTGLERATPLYSAKQNHSVTEVITFHKHVRIWPAQNYCRRGSNSSFHKQMKTGLERHKKRSTLITAARDSLESLPGDVS